MHVCPTKATYKTEDGVVLIDWNKCIGCKYCMIACPYGVRFYTDSKSRWSNPTSRTCTRARATCPGTRPTRGRSRTIPRASASSRNGVVSKCTFCYHKISKAPKGTADLSATTIRRCASSCPPACAPARRPRATSATSTIRSQQRQSPDLGQERRAPARPHRQQAAGLLPDRRRRSGWRSRLWPSQADKNSILRRTYIMSNANSQLWEARSTPSSPHLQSPPDGGRYWTGARTCGGHGACSRAATPPSTAASTAWYLGPAGGRAYVFFVLTSTGLTFVASLAMVFGIRDFYPIAKRCVWGALVTLIAGFMPRWHWRSATHSACSGPSPCHGQ
jgi:Fe-S-cluster-containing dehydrogenase component